MEKLPVLPGSKRELLSVITEEGTLGSCIEMPKNEPYFLFLLRNRGKENNLYPQAQNVAHFGFLRNNALLPFPLIT